jgi:hypothetical protein
MIDASSSLRPSRVKTAPRPALKRVVLELNDRAGHGIQAGAAGLEHGVAGGQRLRQPRPVEGLLRPAHFRAGQGARAAMQRQGDHGAVKRLP